MSNRINVLFSVALIFFFPNFSFAQIIFTCPAVKDVSIAPIAVPGGTTAYEYKSRMIVTNEKGVVSDRDYPAWVDGKIPGPVVKPADQASAVLLGNGQMMCNYLNANNERIYIATNPAFTHITAAMGCTFGEQSTVDAKGNLNGMTSCSLDGKDDWKLCQLVCKNDK